jgi:UDP-glucuronate 4-epimerase
MGDERLSGSGLSPTRFYNIGNGAPVRLMDFIEALETELGVTAEKNLLPMQPRGTGETWQRRTGTPDGLH